MVERTYIAIDLKSFYASSECVELGFDPLRTHLVVADESRTDKTICLAVSPSLKAYGLPGRARLFEVREKLRQINAERQLRAPGASIPTGTSYYADDAGSRSEPGGRRIHRQAENVALSQRQRKNIRHLPAVRLRGRHPRLLHRRSVHGRHRATCTPTEKPRTRLARDIVRAIYNETGITATAGIGTNLYLAKVAMDIVAKHIPADAEGVRIAQLDEMSYRRLLWGHRPLTDFWRVGRGYAKKARIPRAHDHGRYRPLLTSGEPPTITTRNCSTACSASTRSCSSTMRGDGSPAP